MVKIINKPIGRPNLEVDYAEVLKLAMLHCTVSEIASSMGLKETTLAASEEFQGIYKKGLEDGRKSLRRQQEAKAAGQDAKLYHDKNGEEVLDAKGRPIVIQPGYAPDTTMQIWLGKQQLGQTDQLNPARQEVAVTIVHKNFEKGKKEKENPGDKPGSGV